MTESSRPLYSNFTECPLGSKPVFRFSSMANFPGWRRGAATASPLAESDGVGGCVCVYLAVTNGGPSDSGLIQTSAIREKRRPAAAEV